MRRVTGVPAGVLLVTGTDTGVGKTVVTAALAASYPPGEVAVDKPTQTGVRPGEEGDVDTVGRLAGVTALTEGVRLPDPMAPVAAARRAGTALPPLAAHAARVTGLAARFRTVLVEGAGGVLVPLCGDGATLADLAVALLAGHGPGVVGAVVVCRAGLGTLNHTALTLEALGRRGIPVRGVVVGSWPAAPDDVERDNLAALAGLGAPLLGAVPSGAGTLAGPAFRRAAPGWFGRRAAIAPG